MSITSAEDAVVRLLEWQVEEGGVPTQPAYADTTETAMG